MISHEANRRQAIDKPEDRLEIQPDNKLEKKPDDKLENKPDDK
jgi:hypothetical protein